MAKKKVVKKSAKKVIKKVTKKSAPAPKKVAKKTIKKVAKKVAKKAKPAPKKVAPPKAKPKAKRAAPKPAAVKPVAAPVASVLPAIGSDAPAFTLPSSTGKDISLADYSGKTVVVYFYPKADTPGCTVEACGFRDAIASYGKLSVDVLGISPDPIGPVKKFADKFSLTFPLLADADHKITEAFGCWVQKSMYGKTYMGAARNTFIIKDSKVAYIFEKVKPEGHEAEVLKALESL